MLKIKSIYICCIIIIFYGCNNVVDILSKNNKGSENDLSDYYNLNGKVKEVKAIRFNTERLFGEIEKMDTLSIDITKFNRKGFVTESSHEYFKASEYDNYSYNMWKYKYSDNIKSVKRYDKDGKLKSHRIYDSNGDNITQVYSLSHGDTILLYDEIYREGLLIETNRYDDENYEYLHYKTKCKYNSKGELTEESEYNREGKLKKKHLFKRDNKGNAIEYQRDSFDDYDEISETYLYVREFDELNNEIYEKRVSYRPEYRLEDMQRDTSEYFTSYNYEKDNWIKKETKYVSSYSWNSKVYTSVYITERTIIYY